MTKSASNVQYMSNHMLEALKKLTTVVPAPGTLKGWNYFRPFLVLFGFVRNYYISDYIGESKKATISDLVWFCLYNACPIDVQ